VAVNRPGYGQSDPAESGLASVADDTVAVADSLAVHRFAVLGASGGGPYALACAARHPDRVAAVGTVACPGVVPELDPPRLHEDPEDERDARVRELLEAGDVEAAVVELSAAIRGYRDHVLDEDDATVVDRWAEGMHPDDVEVAREAKVRPAFAACRNHIFGRAVGRFPHHPAMDSEAKPGQRLIEQVENFAPRRSHAGATDQLLGKLDGIDRGGHRISPSKPSSRGKLGCGTARRSPFVGSSIGGLHQRYKCSTLQM